MDSIWILYGYGCGCVTVVDDSIAWHSVSARIRNTLCLIASY